MLSRDSFFSEPLNVERNPKHCKDRSLFVSVFHSNWDAESLHFCSFNIGLFRDSLSRFYFRLQNSPYFCVFKYARAVKQKVWNEAENRERDWGKDKTLTPRFTDFFTHFEKKTDCFAVYFYLTVQELRDTWVKLFMQWRYRTLIKDYLISTTPILPLLCDLNSKHSLKAAVMEYFASNF